MFEEGNINERVHTSPRAPLFNSVVDLGPPLYFLLLNGNSYVL